MYSPQVTLESSKSNEYDMNLNIESLQERDGCIYWKGKCMRLPNLSELAFPFPRSP
jgi:hypothetical protein